MVGRALGARLGVALRRVPLVGSVFGAFNAAGGALAGAGVALVLIGLFGLSALQGPIPEARQMAEDSRVVGLVEERVPEESVIGTLISGITFFTAPATPPDLPSGSLPGVPPEAPPDVPSQTPTSGAASSVPGPVIQEAAQSTVRVVGSRGLSGSTGSGWVAAPNLVVTNAHVVEDASYVAVQPQGGWRQLSAEVELSDRRADVAVLRVENLDLRPLPVAEASAGEPVAALGYPGGGPFEASAGRVGPTAIAPATNPSTGGVYSRPITALRAEVMPGNSGGPVIDATGRVVATVFGEAARGTEIAYAIPSSATEERVVRATSAAA
jgi:S1-C subfamily serine protease